MTKMADRHKPRQVEGQPAYCGFCLERWPCSAIELAPPMADQGPRKHKTVAELIALLSTFPPDTPVAKCSDEFGTYWDIEPKLERLTWRSIWNDDKRDWVWFWPDAELENGIPNGTETDHVIL